jgi:integrase
MDAVTLAARMGHSDVATTKRHYIIPQHDRERALADLAASLDPFKDEG